MNYKTLLIFEELPESVNYYLSKKNTSDLDLTEISQLHNNYANHCDYEFPDEIYIIGDKYLYGENADDLLLEQFDKIEFPLTLDNETCINNVIHFGFNS